MTRKSTAKQAGKSRGPRSFDIVEETKPVTDRKQAGKTQTTSRKPKAVPLEADLVYEDDSAVDAAYKGLEQLEVPPPPKLKRRRGWGKLALGAFSALFALAIGLSIDQLIGELFARNDWMGWIAVGLTVLGTIGLLAVALREIWGIWRLKSLERFRERAKEAVEENNLEKARELTRDIVIMFSSRADTAHGRASLSEHGDAVMDGADLIHLLERDLVAPLDKTARSLVMGSAKRVSVVTAVSPRALVDIAFVLYENMRLIRQISEHYGGRPGALSSIRLAREVLTHLAATGAIAAGDGLLQQVIGHGVAARLSSRLGEGVVNGLLTARIGIAAIDVCRPLPFDTESRPGIRDFISSLAGTGTSNENTT